MRSDEFGDRTIGNVIARRGSGRTFRRVSRSTMLRCRAGLPTSRRTRACEIVSAFGNVAAVGRVLVGQEPNPPSIHKPEASPRSFPV